MNKLRWLSSINPKNEANLAKLKDRLEHYYRSNKDYYHDIDNSGQLWNDPNYLPYQAIKRMAEKSKAILELGSGRAAILSALPGISNRYTGIDFSKDLVRSNSERYPGATFFFIFDSSKLNLPTGSFDLIFSVFVLEHVVNPQIFLDEACRLLKSKGKLVIVCPDYMGHLWMASQKVGLSQGSGMEKLKKGKILDFLLTGFESRMRIPIYAYFKRLKAHTKPKFYVNVHPTCFEYKFQPDVDAVYVTCEKEIKTYLSERVAWIGGDSKMDSFCKERRLLFLTGTRK